MAKKIIITSEIAHPMRASWVERIDLLRFLAGSSTSVRS